MRTWLFALFLWLPLSAWSGEAKPMADDPVLEQRMTELSENLRCLVCQNESLASSRADLAQDLRQEIREQLRSGKDNDQVISYLTQRYGDFVLYNPPMKPKTWLLWFGPFALLLGGVAGLYIYIKRRARQLAETSFSDEEKSRVEALLNNDNGTQS